MSNRRFFVLSIISFTVLRILWFISLRTLPHVDFAAFDYIAELLSRYSPIYEPLPKSLLLPAWGYPLFLGVWYSLVGHSLFAGKLFNLFLGMACVPLIYAVSRQIGGTLTARVTTILFILWPTQIMMSSVLASEHLAVFLIMVAFFFLLKETQKHHWRNLGVSAIFLALAYIVRHVFIAALPAAVVLLIISDNASKISKMKTASVLMICFTGVYALYLGGMTTVYHVTPLSQGLFNLLVGTSVASKGHWNKEDAEMYLSFPTFREANSYAKKEILRRITSNPAGIVKLMGQKSILTWWNGTYGFYWSTLKVSENPLTSKILSYRLFFEGIAHYFHLLILLFATMGYLALYSDIKVLKYSPIFFMLVFGTGLHMILETQYRYNYVMIPFLSIIAAKGICSVYRPVYTGNLQHLDHR
ncbi:MAG: glycosyltransferase family 39 protein [Desulforhabdus sp.]|jgi:4-amino-4-deoxy-L-arabinose transferase-like glycosyltransferase|nr:glycosyltransferase family 39 protein [Desulforhabdus sp.]